MRVVLTGAAGLTGGAVLRALQDRDHEVVAVVRQEAQRAALASQVEVVLADCADTARMDRIVGSGDALVHVAGIQLGSRLAQMDSLFRLRRMVVVSSAGIYSRHRASATVYKRNEDAIRAARPDATLVRPTMIYGSTRDRNVHHVVAFASRYRFLPLIGSGRALIQPIHYEDLALGVAALVEAALVGPLDAGGGAPLTVRAAAEAIFAALRVPARFVRVPLRPAIALTRLADRLIDARLAERVERLTEDRSVDITAFSSITGVTPRIFSDGVRAQVSTLRR